MSALSALGALSASSVSNMKANDIRRDSLELLWIHNTCSKLKFVISTSYRSSFIFHHINKYSKCQSLQNLLQISSEFSYPVGLFNLVSVKAAVSVVLGCLFEEVDGASLDLLRSLISSHDYHLFSPLFPSMIWELLSVHAQFKDFLKITPFQSLRFKYDSESESSKRRFKRYSIGYNILSLFSLSPNIIVIPSHDLMILAAFVTTILRKKVPSSNYFESTSTRKETISNFLKQLNKIISLCGLNIIISCLFPGWNITETDLLESLHKIETSYPDNSNVNNTPNLNTSDIPLFNVAKNPVVLIKQIGAGTYSKVYEIRNPIPSETLKHHTSFAYKVFRENDFLDSYSLRELFTNTCLPPHRNITKLVAIFVDSGAQEYRLAFEMCIGDLMKLAQTTKPMDKNYAFKESFGDFVSDVSFGIFHLHQNGFIHRDISPGNILISIDNVGKLVYKISDFSLTRTINSSNKYSSIGFCLWYRPPEVLLNQMYSSLSDMWGIGCLIFFYASKGIHLFKSNDELDLKNNHLNWYGNQNLTEQLPVSHIKQQCGHHLFLRPEVETQLYNLISGLLTFDPTKRLSSKQLCVLLGQQSD